MQAQLFGLLDIAQDAQTRTASSVELEKRRLLKALADKTARALRAPQWLMQRQRTPREAQE